MPPPSEDEVQPVPQRHVEYMEMFAKLMAGKCIQTRYGEVFRWSGGTLEGRDSDGAWEPRGYRCFADVVRSFEGASVVYEEP